jgi:hypothetical protein
MTDRRMSAILLGTVAWIVALLILRLAFDALAVAPPAAASTPLAWQALPSEAFSPMSRSDPAILGVPPVAGAATETPSQSEVSVHLPDASRAPSPSARTRPVATVKPPAPHPKPGALLTSGVATWYCRPGVSRCTRGYPASGAYGAAGPELRAALGNWRGRTVHVNGVAVKLIDFCACGGNHVIDVYYGTWVTIPHPSRVRVTR